MNVRSSTRATSAGSEGGQEELGRLASLSLRKVPAATSSRASASYSSAEPSHQCTAAGWHTAAHSSTHALRRSLLVLAVIYSPFRGVGRGRAPGRRETRGAHVDLGAEAQAGRQASSVQVEDDPLPGAEHAEDRA